MRTAIAEYEKEPVDPDAASAYTTLSRTLLIEGKFDDARKALQRASQASRTSLDPAVKYLWPFSAHVSKLLRPMIYPVAQPLRRASSFVL